MGVNNSLEDYAFKLAHDAVQDIEFLTIIEQFDEFSGGEEVLSDSDAVVVQNFLYAIAAGL